MESGTGLKNYGVNSGLTPYEIQFYQQYEKARIVFITSPMSSTAEKASLYAMFKLEQEFYNKGYRINDDIIKAIFDKAWRIRTERAVDEISNEFKRSQRRLLNE